MIRIEDVSMSYQRDQVLKNLNLHVRPGEFVFLQGTSGSGKSTLLKILYREIDHYAGQIWMQDKPIRDLPKYATRRTVGTIFQSFELLERKTVLENVALAGEVLGRNEKEIEAEALVLIRRVGLAGKEDRFPNQLSGGEQQRVAIARALLNRPLILLADEPTGNLDPDNARNIMGLLKEINEQDGITMLIVTHSEELVRAFPARTIRMKDGQVNEHSDAEILLT